MKIAVVGSGISGLTCAYLLSDVHEVTLYEKDNRLGGHTSTVLVDHETRQFAVDTGFIVFNEKNYPNFCRLIERLKVKSRPTTMSFSVCDRANDFEFGGSSIAGVVGTAKNVLRPRWWSVIRGVFKLRSTGREALAQIPEQTTIAELYQSGDFSKRFLDNYLLPMAAAIWSAPRDDLMRFPAIFFLRFFDNHGMLDLRRRPQWKTIVGGSRSYIDAMMPKLRSRVRLAESVVSVRRTSPGVLVRTQAREEGFDHVVLAAHADESLAMLADPSDAEREILSAMPYQTNDVVLHTDASLLPRRPRCWAAWNYQMCDRPERPAIVTYNMSMLQGFRTRVPLCVTLNSTERIDPAKVLHRSSFAHPLYTIAGERARARIGQISGVHGTHYCGAYWGNGFHEDGVNSALRVCERLGASL